MLVVKITSGIFNAREIVKTSIFYWRHSDCQMWLKDSRSIYECKGAQ